MTMNVTWQQKFLTINIRAKAGVYYERDCRTDSMSPGYYFETLGTRLCQVCLFGSVYFLEIPIVFSNCSN